MAVWWRFELFESSRPIIQWCIRRILSNSRGKVSPSFLLLHSTSYISASHSPFSFVPSFSLRCEILSPLFNLIRDLVRASGAFCRRNCGSAISPFVNKDVRNVRPQKQHAFLIFVYVNLTRFYVHLGDSRRKGSQIVHGCAAKRRKP